MGPLPATLSLTLAVSLQVGDDARCSGRAPQPVPTNLTEPYAWWSPTGYKTSQTAGLLQGWELYKDDWNLTGSRSVRPGPR
eukprot:362067-Chlamydomonas_euryale.AAC.2